MITDYEAKYWHPLSEQRVECLLCPHHCRISPDHSGICRARKNINGRLIAWSYGKITSIALDPIEKKPLKFFEPGSKILSVGTFGCNFHCGFCQNWTIAQQEAPSRNMQPDELALLAREMVPQGNIGLAHTYNEPMVGFEFVMDCARLIRADGLKTVIVTNGYIDPDPLTELLPWVDAMNIDLKAWGQDFYSKTCGGQVDIVKKNIISAAAACHVEITTLLIPGLNDSEQDVLAIAEWLAAINPEIPLHLTRHHPDFRMPDPQPIERQRLLDLAEKARKSLKNVLTGNI